MIEAEDLFVLHRGVAHDVVALRGLSLSVATAERVVVHGPSGSGKSTLVRVLTGELAPSAGKARLFGRDILAVGPRGMGTGELVGVVSQGSGNDLAPELTCVQNVALQARLFGHSSPAAGQLAQAALHRFGIGALAHRHPTTLSNGEAQKVGIAAALVCSPRVIIADEPTGELDRANADAVYRLLAEQAETTGASLLLVTHDPAAVGFADRSVTIRDGRVSEERVGADDRLIVDSRGWVRLPASSLDAAGITDRAQLQMEPDRSVVHLARPTPATAAGGGGGAISFAAGSPPRAVDTGERGAIEPTASRHLAVLTDSPVGTSTFVVTDVSVTVDDTVVLAPVSLEVGRGLTVISGPSGCGKTTLLGLLAGLGPPSTGTVTGAPGVTIAVCTSLAGFAETLDVRGNIDVARAARGLQSGDRFDCEPILDALGIAHLAQRPVRHLSGGERQRVGIARALCSGAQAVLLDEPTSQLDEASALQVARTLAVFGRTHTVVCTSHDAALIGLANHLVELG